MVCAFLMNVRLFTVSETALAGVRVRTFRHIHDLSTLHQQAERRGSLVSRVTSDVDQISQFLQWGGIILLISFGQLTVTTIVMATYSWQLTLVVYVAFLPMVFVSPDVPAPAGPRVRRPCASTSARCSPRSGRAWSAPTVIRAYGVAERTEARLDDGDRAQPGAPSSAPCAPP